MEEFLTRTQNLIGEKAVQKLQNSTVLVFGLGGVGSYTVEALARAGINHLVLVDGDVIAKSNINRQLFATVNTVNKPKTEAAVQRINSINPHCEIETYSKFITADNIDEICFSGVDYVVDAIDTVSTKLEIVKKAQSLNIPIISSMGTGNKLNANIFKIEDIKNTKVCPLCKVMRKLCKENNIESLKVLYSEEEPIKQNNLIKESEKLTPASISYVPAVAGLLIAGEVIKDLVKGC